MLRLSSECWESSARDCLRQQPLRPTLSPPLSAGGIHSLVLTLFVCHAHPWGGSVFLLQWLRGLPTSRMSFNTIFGECPYCNQVSHIAVMSTPPTPSTLTHSHSHSLTLTHTHTPLLPPSHSQSPSKHCTVISCENKSCNLITKQKFREKNLQIAHCGSNGLINQGCECYSNT